MVIHRKSIGDNVQIDTNTLILSIHGENKSLDSHYGHGQYCWLFICYKNSSYSHSSGYDSYNYIDGCNISIYTRRPQLLCESDEDSNSESLYYLLSLERSHLGGIWFNPMYTPIGSI